MKKLIAVISLLCAVALSGCSYQTQINRAEAYCKSQKFATMLEQAECFTHKERPIFARHYPDSLSAYDDYRTEIAYESMQVDVKNIDMTTFAQKKLEADAPLAEAMQQEDAARNARAAQNAAVIGSIFSAALQGVAAYEQQRANSDAAMLNANQQATVVVVPANYVAPRPSSCTPYCQAMISLGKVTQFDPCAVQCR